MSHWLICDICFVYYEILQYINTIINIYVDMSMVIII